MPRQSPEKKITQLKCEIERLQAAAKEMKRKRATREKIIFGAAVMKAMEASVQDRERLVRELDPHITRDCDRDLVGLPRRKPTPPPTTDDDLDDFIR